MSKIELAKAYFHAHDDITVRAAYILTVCLNYSDNDTLLATILYSAPGSIDFAAEFNPKVATILMNILTEKTPSKTTILIKFVHMAAMLECLLQSDETEEKLLEIAKAHWWYWIQNKDILPDRAINEYIQNIFDDFGIEM